MQQPVAPVSNASVSSKAEQGLLRAFPGASAVKWNSLGAAYHVCFMKEGRRVTAVFNEDGRLSYSIAELKQEEYSGETAAVIRSGYSQYKLVQAVEIKVNGSTVQQVILTDGKEYVTIKTDGHEVEVRTLAVTEPGK